MRTTELHRLREERWRHLQQLDQLEKTKDLLEKANARVEDLTVQLAAKTELERYAGNASFILLCNRRLTVVWLFAFHQPSILLSGNIDIHLKIEHTIFCFEANME